MVTVYNNVDKVAGDPQSSVEVVIDIVWDDSSSVAPTHTSTETMIIGPFKADTDELGHWETSLVPNPEILPANNAYKVTETVGTSVVSYYIYVTDSATPSYWSQEVIIEEPEWI